MIYQLQRLVGVVWFEMITHKSITLIAIGAAIFLLLAPSNSGRR